MGRLGDLSPAASIAVGILVGLLSTSIQSIGLTLQRKSHLLEDSKEDELARRPPYRRRKWQLGMLMFVISNIVGSTIQITTLPLPVLSTLQASGLVFNTICATLILNEAFTRWSLGGTILVAAGAVLIALYGALPEPTHNLSQLLVLLGRAQFIGWIFGTFLMMAVVLLSALLLPRFTRLTRRLSFQYQSLQPHHHTEASKRTRLYTGMSFGFVSAVLSAHCLLLAKSAVELILTSLPFTNHGPAGPAYENQFKHYQSYLIIIALVFFALSQLYFLHRGLKLASTSVLYPFVFCVYNVVAILDGLIYFDQTDRLPPLHAGLVGLGTVILLGGVLALSWRLDEQGLQQEREWNLDHPVTPTAQISALAPGMGLVEDTLTESPSATDDAKSDDEESGLISRRLPGASESTPLLTRQTSHKVVNFDVSADTERRPGTGYGTTSGSRSRSRRDSASSYSKSRRSSILTTPTPKRTRFVLPKWDRAEVYGALMDDKEALVSPVAGKGDRRHRRRQTVTGMPSKRAIQSSEGTGIESDGDDEGPSGPRSRNGIQSLKRSKTAPFRSSEDATAWKKRRRRPGEGGEGRSVSSPLLGQNRPGPARRTTSGMVEWVGGLVVSNR